MKPTKFLRSFLLASGSSLLAVTSASAQLTWDGNSTTTPNPNGGNGTWDTTTTNWWNGTTNVTWPSSGTNNDAVFANTAGTVSIAAGGVTANDLTFNTTGYTIQNNSLTLNGTTPTISMATGIAATISSQISGSAGLTKSGIGSLTLSGNNNYSGLTTINGGAIILGNNSALGSSTAGSGTTINGGTSNVTNLTNSAVLDLGAVGRTLSESFNLNGSSAGRATIYNVSNVNHVLDGNIDVTSDTSFAQIRSELGSITVNGDITGTLTNGALFALRGASTSTSNRVLGSVNIGSSALTKFDAGTWTIGAASKTYVWGGTSVVQGTLRMGLADVLPSATVVTLGQNDANAATLDLNGLSQTVAGIQLASTPGSGTRTITSSTAATLTLGSASNFTYGGALTGAGLALTKTGTGTQILSGTNTYGGVTTVTNGTLQFARQLSLYNNTPASWTAANIRVRNGGTLALNVGGTGEFTTGNVTTLLGNLGGANGTSTNGFAAGSSIAFDTTNTSGGTFTVADVIANSTGTGGGAIGVTKLGSNTLVLTNTNTYTGGTTINAGTLAFNNGSLGSSGNITFGSTSTLQWNGANTQDVSSRIVMTSGVNSTFNTNGNDVSFASGIGATGASLTKAGAGKLTLQANATYTGTTTISGGTLEVQGSIASSGITNNGALIFNNSSAQSYGSVIDGSGSLTKEGAGALNLTGANSYSGATNINGGTLHISGTGGINGSSGITVNGGHFKYNSSTNLTAPLTFTSGTVSGTNLTGVSLTVGAGDTVSPGNSPGTMNVANQTWAAGGTYLWELYDATGVAGTGWDLLAGTGTLDITASLGSEFIIDLTTLAAVAPDVLGDAINFNASNSYAWLIADFVSVTGFNTSDFTIDATGFTNAPLSGSFGISLGGNGSVPGDNSQIYITYTAIPEPGAALLGGLGVLTLLRRRRSA